MKALSQNQIIKNSLYAFSKTKTLEEKNEFSLNCLSGLRKWIMDNEEIMSEKKYEKALMIISAPICNADSTVENPGFDYDRAWLCDQLKKNGIFKLDKQD